MEDGSSDSSKSNGDTDRNNKVAEKTQKLEELDKEELVKRCKNYLLLAQRAKSAKDGSLQSYSHISAALMTHLFFVIDNRSPAKRE